MPSPSTSLSEMALSRLNSLISPQHPVPADRSRSRGNETTSSFSDVDMDAPVRCDQSVSQATNQWPFLQPISQMYHSWMFGSPPKPVVTERSSMLSTSFHWGTLAGNVVVCVGGFLGGIACNVVSQASSQAYAITLRECNNPSHVLKYLGVCEEMEDVSGTTERLTRDVENIAIRQRKAGLIPGHIEFSDVHADIPVSPVFLPSPQQPDYHVVDKQFLLQDPMHFCQPNFRKSWEDESDSYYNPVRRDEIGLGTTTLKHQLSLFEDQKYGRDRSASQTTVSTGFASPASLNDASTEMLAPSPCDRKSASAEFYGRHS